MFVGLIVVFSNCFQIIHYLALRKDGSIRVHWRLTVSKSMMQMGKKSKKTSLTDSIAELKSNLSGLVEDLRISKINSEFDTGVNLRFTSQGYKKLKNKEEYPILPSYDPVKRTLTFLFKAPKKTRPNETRPNETRPMNQPNMQKINPGAQMASAIMSSVKYRIILGGRYKPRKAHILGLSSKSKKPLELLRYGRNVHLDIPLHAQLGLEQKGFKVVVQLK